MHNHFVNSEHASLNRRNLHSHGRKSPSWFCERWTCTFKQTELPSVENHHNVINDTAMMSESLNRRSLTTDPSSVLASTPWAGWTLFIFEFIFGSFFIFDFEENSYSFSLFRQLQPCVFTILPAGLMSFSDTINVLCHFQCPMSFSRWNAITVLCKF